MEKQGIGYNIPGKSQAFVKSSSVIFIRPKKNPKMGEADFEILFLKRAFSLTEFGGFFMFPGGLTDTPGDTYEYWN